MSRELLVPADAKIKNGGCLFALTVYTVDTSNYKYQFIGYAFSFLSDSTSPTVTFRIDRYDGEVYAREPKTKHLIKLTLFRKFSKLSGAESPSLPSKIKRRHWTTANIRAAEPVLLSALALKLISLSASPPLPCEELIVSWNYVIQVEGRTYTFRWSARNALDVTIDGMNQFALGKKGSAYLIDDNGKERRVQLAPTAKNPLIFLP